MIQTYAHQKELHEARIDIKTLERLFANVITEGTNCSPFESDIIVEKAKEVFAIGDHSESGILQPGQMIWTAVDLNEPPGKPLKDCQLKRVTLTHISPKEDSEVRRIHGPSAKRQQQIVRMAVEAKDQKALLTQEDLGEILDTDVRTIRRDIQALRENDIMVPTRGQIKDIGPGVTHRVKAITLFLEEKEPLEIARQIKHSLTAVERYIDTFCRVVYCQRRFRNNLRTSLIVGVSVAAVNTYLSLHTKACEDPAYRERISEIEQRGLIYYKNVDFKKAWADSKEAEMKSGKTSVSKLFGPLQRKTFAAALSQFFEEQCPQMGGQLTRDMLVKNIQQLVEKFYPPNTHLRMGQVMWPAVDEHEKASYGKTIEKTKLKPVFVDLISQDDIEAVLQGERAKIIRQRATMRLFKQAKAQGGVLTGVDVGAMMRLSPATISRYVREWEKEYQELIPRRGTIHDMGRSITHKKQICYRVIVEGKSIETAARETNHSPEAVTRYVKDYKRILACLNKGLTPKDTAFVAKVSENLVYEYMNLIIKNQNDIDNRETACQGCDFDDIPF